MEVGVKETFTNYRAGSIPTLYYVPQFITDYEQEQLLDHIYQAPVSKWKSLKNRRLQNWGGVVHDQGLLPQDSMNFIPHLNLRDCSIPMSNSFDDKDSKRALERETDGTLEKYHPFSVLLMPRSLLIFKHMAYSDYLHGIEDSDMQQCDRAVKAAENFGYGCPLVKESEVTNGEGCTSIHRTSTRVSLTCRVVSKVRKNKFV